MQNCVFQCVPHAHWFIATERYIYTVKSICTYIIKCSVCPEYKHYEHGLERHSRLVLWLESKQSVKGRMGWDRGIKWQKLVSSSHTQTLNDSGNCLSPISAMCCTLFLKKVNHPELFTGGFTVANKKNIWTMKTLSCWLWMEAGP